METEFVSLHPRDPDSEVVHTVRRRGLVASEPVAQRPRFSTAAPRRDGGVAGHESAEVLAWEELALALGHRVGLPFEEAERDAGFVMDIFGFEDRVIDNVLERPDRQFFYILEEEGMLTTDREETALWDGREWRTHYWQLRKSAIKGMADEGNQIKQRRSLDRAEAVYASLPPEAWAAARI